MIKHTIISEEAGHILIQVNEPCRIEIIKNDNGYLLYGYKGTATDFRQEPCLFYETVK